MFSDNLNRILSELKKLKKISQAQIARQLGVTPSNLNDWAKGRSVPGADKITKIAEVLGVAVSDLIDEPPSPEPIPPILFSVSEKKPHQSEADAQLLALSEKEKEIALSFIKYLKDNKII